MPHWLESLSIASLIASGAAALVILFDFLSRPQKMWIMNLVWPLTALWAGLLGLWCYFKFGRSSATPPRSGEKQQPFPVLAGKGTLHCGSGCTLGDLAAEWLIVLMPLSLFGHKIFGAWLYDFILAFAFGIAFQYFTIKPMKNLSPSNGLAAAIKADCASLTAWQVGMYGWMAVVTFVIVGHELSKTDPIFWFMMQIGMAFGFLTSYPVNVWLLKLGVKEPM